MKIILHKKFLKNYIKLSNSDKKRFQERRNLFLNNPFDPILNNHQLHGKYKKYRSINITSDLRVIYEQYVDDVIFIMIDTHSNLY